MTWDKKGLCKQDIKYNYIRNFKFCLTVDRKMKKTKPRLGDSICNAHNLQRIDIQNQ